MTIRTIRTVETEADANDLLTEGWSLFSVVAVGFICVGTPTEMLEGQSGLRYVMVKPS